MRTRRKDPHYAARGFMSRGQVKAAVRERDGNRCTDCGMTAAQHKKRHGKNLDVHRLTPGSVYTVDGCVTLCKPCHRTKDRRRHGEKDIEENGRASSVKRRLVKQLELLAERNESDFTDEVNIAVRERLERNGLWPPPE